MDEPRYLLIVKVVRGLLVMDLPRPQAQGGRVVRAMPVGSQLYSLGIHNIAGVNYARLVPRDPLHPEWVRVAEADGSIEYVDVIDLKPANHEISDLTNAITLLATAIRDMKK